MYFSSVLLLLLVSKFVQLQPVPRQTETDLIPFDQPYTPLIQTFMEKMMSDFEVSRAALLQLHVVGMTTHIREVISSKFDLK